MKNIVIIALLMLAHVAGWAQKIGDVKPQSEVFTQPSWSVLSPSEKNSARAMTWHDYYGCDTVNVWNSIEKGLAEYQIFSGKDSILVVTLENGEEATYRLKCHNRNLRGGCFASKGVDEIIPIPTCCSDINITMTSTTNVFLSTTNQQAPAVQNCCNRDSGLATFALYLSSRWLHGGQPLLNEGWEPALGFSVTSWKAKETPSGKFVRKPFGFYAFAEISRGEKGKGEAVCDTCGIWKKKSKDHAFNVALGAGPIFTGWKPVERFSWMSVNAALLARYDTPLKENAGWTGFNIEAPVSLLFGRENRPHLELTIAEHYHPFPSKPASFGPGAFVTSFAATFVLPIGEKSNDKSPVEKQKQKLSKKITEVKAKNTQRDSIRREEKLVRDSVALDTFLLKNPQPIVLDTNELALLSGKYDDPAPQKVLGLKFKNPLPLTKAAKDGKIRKQTLKVAQLKLQQNELKDEVQSGKTENRPALQNNIHKLDREQKKLNKFKKPSVFKRIGKAFAKPFKKNRD